MGTCSTRLPYSPLNYLSADKRELNFPFVQIAELESECNEANQEKQKNAQLTVRVKELEAELQEKEQVRLQHIHLQTGSLSRAGFSLRACKASGLLPLKPLWFTQSPRMKAITAFRVPLHLLILQHSVPSGGFYTSG